VSFTLAHVRKLSVQPICDGERLRRSLSSRVFGSSRREMADDLVLVALNAIPFMYGGLSRGNAGVMALNWAAEKVEDDARSGLKIPTPANGRIEVRWGRFGGYILESDGGLT
jgi:hypothetical protein